MLFSLNGSNIRLEQYIKDKYISKDKVREKISYLQERVEEYRKLKEYNQIDIQLYKINILKELLENN